MDQAIEDLFAEVRGMKAKEFPIREVATVNQDLSCIELIDSFLDQSAPLTLVTNDEGKYIGVLTIKDILPLLQKRRTDLRDVLLRTQVLSCITAFDLAKRQLPTIMDDDEVIRIAGLMASYDVVYLPRVKERKGPVVGVISLLDILAQIKEYWNCACSDEEEE